MPDLTVPLFIAVLIVCVFLTIMSTFAWWISREMEKIDNEPQHNPEFPAEMRVPLV